MSEEKAPRSMKDIHGDYQQLALKAGQAQYQIHALSKDLDILNESMRDLNFEAAAVNASAAKAEAEKSQPEQKGESTDA